MASVAKATTVSIFLMSTASPDISYGDTIFGADAGAQAKRGSNLISWIRDRGQTPSHRHRNALAAGARGRPCRRSGRVCRGLHRHDLLDGGEQGQHQPLVAAD